MSFDRGEVELATRRRIDFEYLQHVIREVAERMRHAGWYKNDLIGSDRIGCAIGRERSLASTHNIDIIGL